jgi:hypothetical protein
LNICAAERTNNSPVLNATICEKTAIRNLNVDRQEKWIRKETGRMLNDIDVMVLLSSWQQANSTVGKTGDSAYTPIVGTSPRA